MGEEVTEDGVVILIEDRGTTVEAVEIIEAVGGTTLNITTKTRRIAHPTTATHGLLTPTLLRSVPTTRHSQPPQMPALGPAPLLLYPVSMLQSPIFFPASPLRH